MAYVLVFFAGVLATLLVRERGARRMLVLVAVIGAAFGGAALYGAGASGASTPDPPAETQVVPSPPLGDL